jgi:hypothetical protein
MRWIAVVPFLITNQAFAQVSLFDGCKPVITDGLREYSIFSDSSSFLNTVFDKYCDSSGSAKIQSLGFGIDAVVKSIPVQFTGNFSSNEEAVRNFCRDYRSVTVNVTNRNSYEEKIVRRAYDSFDACISMAQTGVIARHRVENVERVNFYLAPGFSRPVTVRGVNPSSNMTCTGQDPTENGTPTEVTFGKTSRYVLQNNTVLGMVCTRKATIDPAGNSVFDEGIVTVLTDINPNGNYTMFLPRDSKLAENQASVIDAKLQSLASETEKLAEQLSKIQNAAGRTAVKATDPALMINNDATASVPGFSGTYMGNNNWECPAGSFVSAIQGFKPDNQPQSPQIRYVCRTVK